MPLKLTDREKKLMEEQEFTEEDIRAVRRAKAARQLDREEQQEREALAAIEEEKQNKKEKGDFDIV